jgi:cytochrome-b5 reductase
VQRYNHNTAVYTFALPDADSFLNLPVSSCIMTRYKGEDGKDVVRPYTPIDTHRKGEIVLMIKTYPEGKMSQFVAHLKPGDTLDVKGPVPKLKYEANMKKKIGSQHNQHTAPMPSLCL